MKRIYYVPYLVSEGDIITPHVINIEIPEGNDVFRDVQELLKKNFEFDNFEFFDDESEIEDGNELYVLIKVENSLITHKK